MRTRCKLALPSLVSYRTLARFGIAFFNRPRRVGKYQATLLTPTNSPHFRTTPAMSV